MAEENETAESDSGKTQTARITIASLSLPGGVNYQFPVTGWEDKDGKRHFEILPNADNFRLDPVYLEDIRSYAEFDRVIEVPEGSIINRETGEPVLIEDAE